MVYPRSAPEEGEPGFSWLFVVFVYLHTIGTILIHVSEIHTRVPSMYDNSFMMFHVYDASTNLFSNSSFPLKL